MFDPKKIKVIVWDVDGTWYRPQNELVKEELRQRTILIADRLGVSYEKAWDLEKEEVKKTKSFTIATANLVGAGALDILKKVQSLIDRSKYLKKDERLIELLNKLSSYRQAIVTNMRAMALEETFKILGIDKNLFDVAVTPESTGVMKPDLAGFRLVLDKTGLKPSEHLFVGDREQVDIIPAKTLGMQTCFVWGKSEIADVSIDEVYLLTEILKSI